MRKSKIPHGLGPEGRKFWRKVTGEYVMEAAHDLERLLMACRCLDEIEQAEGKVKLDGVIIPDRYGSPKEHPATKIIRDNRTLFCRIIRELGLDLSNAPEARPPRRY